MAEFEKSTIPDGDNKDRAVVETFDLSEGTHIEAKFMGTAEDRHDMIVMGRKQVLRVRRPSR